VPGICITNSEVGILSFSIEAYFYHLVCFNSLMSKTSAANRFKHVSRRALEEFPEILRMVIDESKHNQRRFEISTQTHSDNPLAKFGLLNINFRLQKGGGLILSLVKQ